MLKNKTTIVNKKRFFTFILTMVLSVFIFCFVFSEKNKVYSSKYNNQIKEITIKKGDTIWNIALENKPNQYDTRKMVYEIMEINNMKESTIYPGDTIKIPIIDEKK
ncbi:cell division suppressor protein YneA [Sporanaerobacter acetigenes]|uniref:LysM domain-containing protein n=1 Tax=Sporanaerobacter acetigenes DSM 13106 TaxID=1123281 RepID=A0A1M5XKX7_9FIRM|nr:LysM peptidoglycan-binding domain-containing protein [Sporanaerobacter acetigenes]SHI00480.1 LysM domain-containing protein [Sporanaerobacter acetigenes DSM 13106]